MTKPLRTLRPRPTQGVACLFIAVVCAPTFALTQAHEPTVSKVEQRIRDYVRAHETYEVNLLETSRSSAGHRCGTNVTYDPACIA